MGLVVIIDDDEIDNEYTRYCIKKVGTNIDLESFTDPEEAVGFLRLTSHTKYVAIVDLHIGNINGISVVQDLQEMEGKEGRFYMLSGSEAEYSIFTVTDHPAVEKYCIKPFTVELANEILGKL
jgi:DNA-binding NarL/FixJ family response regulator